MTKKILLIKYTIIFVFVVVRVVVAADFELFWDANCNADVDLEGYYIYYKENVSVVDDPSGASNIYVVLTDIGFDPDNPSYLIADLLDDVRYCFAVTAWYGDEESGMSNEICGINGVSFSLTSGTGSTTGGGSGSIQGGGSGTMSGQ